MATIIKDLVMIFMQRHERGISDIIPPFNYVTEKVIENLVFGLITTRQRLGFQNMC